MKHARYYWLLLVESGLTRRLFGAMVRTLRSDAWTAAPKAALRQQRGKMRSEPEVYDCPMPFPLLEVAEGQLGEFVAAKSAGEQ